MATGRVKWFDDGRGFGFAANDDDGGEVFVHQSALQDGVNTLNVGALIEFNVTKHGRSPRATSVRLIRQTTAPEPPRMVDQPAEDMSVIVEDLIKLLDGVSNGLRRGRYPDRASGQKVGVLLRAVANNLEATAGT